VVVATLADFLGDLGRALSGEGGEGARVVGPQPVPRARAEELVEIFAAELERGQFLRDPRVVAGVGELEDLQPEDGERRGARGGNWGGACGLGLHIANIPALLPKCCRPRRGATGSRALSSSRRLPLRRARGGGA